MTPERSEVGQCNPDSDIEVVHVYPLFGREHVVSGWPLAQCWCHPQLEPDCPVLVHNVMQ